MVLLLQLKMNISHIIKKGVLLATGQRITLRKFDMLFLLIVSCLRKRRFSGTVWKEGGTDQN